MIAFQTLLWIIYFLIAALFFPYLKSCYFAQKATGFEKFIIALLAIFWVLSVPVTFIIRDDNSDEGEEQ